MGPIIPCGFKVPRGADLVQIFISGDSRIFFKSLLDEFYLKSKTFDAMLVAVSIVFQLFAHVDDW